MAEEVSLLRRSFSIIGRGFPTLIAAAAWPYVLMALCFLTTAFIYRAHHDPTQPQDPIQVWHSMGAIEKLGVVFAYFASISLPYALSSGSVAAVVWKGLEGKTAGLRDALAAIKTVCGRLVALSLFIALITLVGSFLILPGALIVLFCSLAVPVLVIERSRIGAALKTSVSFSMERIGTILGIYMGFLGIAVLLVFPGVVIFGIASNLGLPWWVGLVTFWIGAVTVISWAMMIKTTILVLLYGDIRLRRNLSQLAGPAA